MEHLLTLTLCTAIVYTTISDLVGVSASIDFFNNATCNGFCDGDATAKGTGGVTPYTYNWNNTSAQTTITATNLCAGTYIVTITDASGCTSSAEVTIIDPTPIVATIADSDSVKCFGENTGSATVIGSGGTSPYNYLWNGGTSPTSPTALGLSAGTYIVTVSTGVSCFDTASVTIYEPTLFSISLSSTDENCGQANGTASVVATGGIQPYTYLWNSGGSTSLATDTNLTAGTYTVIVIDNNGCNKSNSIFVNNTGAGTAIISNKNDVSCIGECDGDATVSISGGVIPYSYEWSTIPVQTGVKAIDLCGDIYTVTVTDGNGCKSIVSVTISEPVGLTLTFNPTNVSCWDGSDGQLEVTATGGFGSYTYLWDANFQQTPIAIGLSEGTYNVTVGDENGCSTIGTASVSDPDSIAISETIIQSSCGNSDGSINITITGGTSPYTYSWSNLALTQNISNVAAGTYTVVVTDSKGCKMQKTIQVTDANSPSVSISILNELNCFGDCNGVVQATATGGFLPYSFIWSNLDETSISTKLCAGIHSVTVTDSLSCSASQSITLTQPQALNAMTSATQTSCNGYCDASAYVIVNGGTPDYSFNWTSSTVNNDSISGLCAGTYYVTITDINSCKLIKQVDIIEPSFVTINITEIPTLCNNSCDGKAIANASGGISPYTYLWDDVANQTTDTAFSLCEGDYILTVSDANNCQYTANATITSPSEVIAQILNYGNEKCNNSNDAFAQVDVSGGTGAYSYNWSYFSSTNNIFNVPSGTYSVTVTDINGCTDLTSINLTEPSPITVILTPTDEKCWEANDGTISSFVTGGVPPYYYSWSNSQISPIATGLGGGVYILNVIDSNYCQVSTSATIYSASNFYIEVDTVINANCGQSNGSGAINIFGGQPDFSYLWSSTNGNGVTINNVAAGTYQIEVTDANGCKDSTDINISDIEGPKVINPTKTNILCNGGNNGDAGFTVVQQVPNPPINYVWSNFASGTVTAGNTININSLTADVYTVIVTDNAGCIGTGSVTITEPSQLLTSITNTVKPLCNGDCDGKAYVIAGGGTSPYSFIWSNGDTLQLQQALCGDTLYSITATDNNGCTATTNVTIIDNAPLQISGIANDLKCYGVYDGSISINVTGGYGVYYYSWSPSPAGGNSNTVGSLPANTYSVSVSDMNNCSISDNFTINNATQIIVQPGSNATTCNGSNGEVFIQSVSGGAGNYNYAWNPQYGQIDNLGTMDSLSAGTYILTVTDANNCKVNSTATVGKNIVPSIFNHVLTMAICNGESSGSVTITIKNAELPLSYPIITPLEGSIQVQDSIIYIDSIPANGYNVLITDANGCPVSDNFTITQPYPMQLYTSASPSGTLCAGTQAWVSANASGGNPGYNFLWTNTNPPNPFQNAPVNPTSLTTYYVFAYDSKNCPIVQDSVTIDVYPALALNTTPEFEKICQGESVDLSASLSGGAGEPYSYIWSNIGSPDTTSSQTISPNYQIDTLEIYVFGKDYYCPAYSDTDTIKIVILPLPNAKIHGDTINGCYPLTVNFNNISHQTGYTYSWDFNDNSSPTSTDSMPSYTFEESGKYDIGLTVTTDEGCSKTITSTNYIEVYPHPTAIFDLSPETVKLMDNPTVYFWDESVMPSIWEWQFGDDAISYDSINVEHQYSVAGIYNVLLTVWNEYGCVDTVSHPVTVLENSTFYAPTAFTPESPINPYFYFRGTGIDKNNFHLYIYDRWGELIFDTDVFYDTDYNPDTRGRWNGKVKNGSKIAETGVYTWYVIYKDVNGKSHDKTGAVTLIK